MEHFKTKTNDRNAVWVKVGLCNFHFRGFSAYSESPNATAKVKLESLFEVARDSRIVNQNAESSFPMEFELICFFYNPYIYNCKSASRNKDSIVFCRTKCDLYDQQMPTSSCRPSRVKQPYYVFPNICKSSWG